MTTFSCFFLYVFVRGSMCGLCMCGTLMLVFGYMHPCVPTESSEWVIMYPPPLTSPLLPWDTLNCKLVIRAVMAVQWALRIYLSSSGVTGIWNYAGLLTYVLGFYIGCHTCRTSTLNNWTIEPSYASFLKSSSSVLEYEFIMPDCDSFQWPWPRLP